MVCTSNEQLMGMASAQLSDVQGSEPVKLGLEKRDFGSK